MSCTSTPPAQLPGLLRLLDALLDQALALAAAHQRPGAPPYHRPVGAHVRHAVEHIEALLALPAGAARVDYDARARDAELERDPAVARQRLLALQHALAGITEADLGRPLLLAGRTGPAGEAGFEVLTTFGRELVFLASHTVHHHAVLMPHCVAHGLPVPADFGQAPATVAHERAAAPATPQRDPS